VYSRFELKSDSRERKVVAKLGGVNHCHQTSRLSFGEIPWFDEKGDIRRCDWTENTFLCMCPVWITRLWVPLQPITAPYFTLLIKPRDFAQRHCSSECKLQSSSL